MRPWRVVSDLFCVSSRLRCGGAGEVFQCFAGSAAGFGAPDELMPIVVGCFGTHQYVNAAFKYWDSVTDQHFSDSASYPNLTVIK
jgi:hypothetical protein